MSYSKRFTLVFSVVALTWTPALLAGDEAAEPSSFEVLINAIVEIFVPNPEEESVEPGDVSNAGPNIPIIG